MTKKGAQIDKLKKLLCPNLLNISKADVSRECDECSFNKTPTQSLAELSIKVGKISDDRGQWNIGWWCLMTNDWASGFCAGVTTVIYSCRSHQSEHFQCSPSSSHFNELGLCFNFAFPKRAISQKKYILHPRYINVIAPLNVCRTSDLEKWTSWKITSNALCRAWVGHTTKKSMTWSFLQRKWPHCSKEEPPLFSRVKSNNTLILSWYEGGLFECQLSYCKERPNPLANWVERAFSKINNIKMQRNITF